MAKTNLNVVFNFQESGVTGLIGQQPVLAESSLGPETVSVQDNVLAGHWRGLHAVSC